MRILIATTLLATLALASSVHAAPGGPGRYALDKGNVAGWTLMSPDERTEFRQKMHSAKTYDECKTYQEEHRKLMETRASEKGVTLRQPRHNACDMMKARGLFK